jgi:uncharacterized UBP type Zn finger protein
MINICVYNGHLIEVEGDEFVLDDQQDIIEFLFFLITKVKYSGKTICLEKVTVVEDRKQFEEIDRW